MAEPELHKVGGLMTGGLARVRPHVQSLWSWCGKLVPKSELTDDWKYPTICAGCLLASGQIDRFLEADDPENAP
jgi:hypothetical protein